MKLDFLKNPDVQIATFAILFIIGGTFAIIHNVQIDNDLKDTESFQRIQTQLENEFKKIELPPKTAVNKFENLSKQDVWANMKTRYRTELNYLEFSKHIGNELTKLGWIRYDGTKFCKGKLDAELSSDNLFSDDGGNYFVLGFSFGMREALSENPFPKECC